MTACTAVHAPRRPPPAGAIAAASDRDVSRVHLLSPGMLLHDASNACMSGTSHWSGIVGIALQKIGAIVCTTPAAPAPAPWS
jgi:hypothetical protein